MSKPKITPLGDRVLVKHVDEDEQIKGGIIIPDSAKEKSQEAEVVALGTGKKDDDGKNIGFQVKKGDVVLISKYGCHRRYDRYHHDRSIMASRLDAFGSIAYRRRRPHGCSCR